MTSRPVPVIKAARFFVAHTPGLVRYGSKPVRELKNDRDLDGQLAASLRSFDDAAPYPPHRALLGSLTPESLWNRKRPYHRHLDGDTQRIHPYGQMVSGDEFFGLLKVSDRFDLVWLEELFAGRIREALEGNPLVTVADLTCLESGHPRQAIEQQVEEGAALPLLRPNGDLIGCICRDHDEDESLSAAVLLENLACKTTGAFALRSLLRDSGDDPTTVDYVLNSGEEAVGERYQRGGGNLAKAMAEMCGCDRATGSDTKAFCCGPVHAVMLGASLIAAGVESKVVVVGGASLAKLGMKFQGHLKHEMPVLEDVLVGVAMLLDADDGVSPVLRLDAIGKHPVAAGSSQQAILEHLVSEPLSRAGLQFSDVDRFATELHDPDITEPSGSGDVAMRNYRLLAGLAAISGEIDRSDRDDFVRTRGLPGFSPTQGHIASAIPYIAHAIEGLKSGDLKRAMFLAKGSLFLGRMTQLSDGLSLILESNPNRRF